jgi:uncharacterized membrane protein (UPF0127 family)
MRVSNTTRGTKLGSSVDIADSVVKRRVGLLGHSQLAPGQGLWLKPCDSIHTFGMKFPIDVVFLGKEHQVLDVRPNMAPGQTVEFAPAHSALEFPAGTLARTQTQIGDELELAVSEVSQLLSVAAVAVVCFFLLVVVK